MQIIQQRLTQPHTLFRHQRSRPTGKKTLQLLQKPALSSRLRGQIPLRLGLLVPFHGSDAIWGPSCQYSAVLAAAEINQLGGILGRQIELFAADAGGNPADVVARARQLVRDHSVDVLVGVHLSSVRVALSDAFAGVLPYVFAPLYEGGEDTPGVFAIGETPQKQFPGAVRWLIENRRAQRWYFVGNDYIWPRATHCAIHQLLSDHHANVVGEDYLGLGQSDIAQVIENIDQIRPDIVFESLVGSDCVSFNRAFSAAGLSRQVIRLSGSIEENTLLGIGAEHTGNLYCAASYFSSLQTRFNQHFMVQYRAAFGPNAPVQGVLSQSCYDAIHFLSALASKAGSLNVPALCRVFENLQFHSVRGTMMITNGAVNPPIYLAKAEEMTFNIVAEFPI